MKVPLIDINASDKCVQNNIKKRIKDIIKRKEFILGKEVRELEEKFAKYIGSKYSIGVSSGSAALFLSLKAAGIKNGDYVVTTPFTFTATAEVIIHCGAKIIFADIDERTYNISPESISRCFDKYGERIKAIIPVHLYGQPCDMDKIMKLAKKYNAKVIEDCAQAHGAEYYFDTKDSVLFGKKKVGAIGELGCFSFYPTKNLGCYGDGGIITTNDDILYEKLLRLRNHGRIEHYLYQEIGFNARLDNLQAGIILEKFKYLTQWNKERQKIAKIYNEELKGVGDIIIPYVEKNVVHVYHLYVIRTKNRNKLAEYLKSNDIGCAVQYAVPLHLQPAYKDKFEVVDTLQNTEKVAKEVLSLPIYPGLKASQIEYVIKKIKSFFN